MGINRIPRTLTCWREVEFWGQKSRIKPAVVKTPLGDGKLLLWFTPIDTRPNFYYVRVDSSFAKMDEGDQYRYVENDVWEAIADQFGEREREREYLHEEHDEATATKLEDEIYFPILCADCGYSWGIERVWNGKRWGEWKRVYWEAK